jgi:preprotein translocase subunit SecG
MTTVLLVVHIFVAIALVLIILAQRSEGGGLGLGGSGGSGSFMSVRGTANLLTRTTAVLAAIFMLTSLGLAMLAGNHGQGSSIIDQIPTGAPPMESGKPAPQVPTPATTPEIPLSK